MTREEAQYIKMTQTPIPKLVTSLAIPTIISMLISSIYNMADTFFVSELRSTSATGAVGIVFSLMAIIQAVGFMLGMGSGSFVSRCMGNHEHHKANTYASSAFFAALLFGVALAVFGTLGLQDLMRILGATETILPYATSYARIILIGAPIMAGSFVLNNLLRAEGKAILSMIGITTGGILNIALDPLFIFGFHLGISGAAYATVLSQTISFLILLYLAMSQHSQLQLSLRNASKTAGTYLDIIKVGFPSFCRQGLASMATVALNTAAGGYGDAAVAAMSVNGRVFMLIFSAMLGYGQGFQPVMGYNYGAKQFNRCKQAFRFTLIATLTIACIIGFSGYALAPTLMQAFAKQDTLMLTIGIQAMRFQCLALLLQPISMLANMSLQSIGKSWMSTLVSCGRQGIFFFPLIYLLPKSLDLTGVELTQPLADVCTTIFAIPFLLHLFRHLTKKQADVQA